MARPDYIELGEGRDSVRIPILYEDRSVLALDKPAGWLLAPFSWQRTRRNLHAAITSSIAAGDYWARSRGLKFLRHVHRLDGDTSGVLLLAKSRGAVNTYGDLFESRRMTKSYLAVTEGVPAEKEWVCHAPLAPDLRHVGQMRIDPGRGKTAETAFRVVRVVGERCLLEARPVTGRTHQIRVHLREAGCPVVGDALYGRAVVQPPGAGGRDRARFPLGLRAVALEYFDPFLRRPVHIRAPAAEFLRAFGLSEPEPEGP